MSKSDIASIYSKNVKTGQIVDTFNSRKKIAVNGLTGSSLSFLTSTLFEKSELPFLLLFNDKEEAAYYLNDLEQLVSKDDVLFYPASYRRTYQIEENDNANV